MQHTEQSNAPNGWLVIDKPQGVTSAFVTNKIKWLLKAKIGHGGTLDPLATGILPIAVGEATKLSSFLLGGRKHYQFTATWGQARDTDDSEGAVINQSKARPTKQDIEDILPLFTGKILQTAPKYSAKKINGKRAYDKARNDEDFIIEPSEIEIYSLTIINTTADSAEFSVECSKGTYIRSLARDMGEKLACLGYISALRRVAHSKFNLDDTITLEKLEELWLKEDRQHVLLPLEYVLDDIPAITLDPEEEKLIRFGQQITAPNESDIDVVILKDQNSKLIAIAQTSGGKIRSKRVFNH